MINYFEFNINFSEDSNDIDVDSLHENKIGKGKH